MLPAVMEGPGFLPLVARPFSRASSPSPCSWEMGQVERMYPFITTDTGDVNDQSNSPAVGKNKSRDKEGWEMGSVCAGRKEGHRSSEH